MASKLTVWNKAGRFLTATVVLCFFLPFFGISCNGVEIISISGADMVGGCKPGGMINELEQQGGDAGGGGGADTGGMTAKVDNVKREPLAIAAMAIALVCFGLAWVRTRPALIASCALAVAGLGTLGALYVKATADMDEATKLEGLGGGAKPDPDAPSFGDEIAEDVEEEVEVDAGARMGFWLTALGFIAVAALAGLAIREKPGAAALPGGSPPYPPPPPPPPPAMI